MCIRDSTPPGLTFKNFTNLVYLTTDGIFGAALYTSSLYIVLFVALGALMEVSGIGEAKLAELEGWITIEDLPEGSDETTKE